MDTIFKTADRLPPKETEVLVCCKGVWKIGALFTEHPTHEDTYQAFDYWDDPTNEGRCWEWDDVTHWMNLPPLPEAKVVQENKSSHPVVHPEPSWPTWNAHLKKNIPPVLFVHPLSKRKPISTANPAVMTLADIPSLMPFMTKDATGYVAQVTQVKDNLVTLDLSPMIKLTVTHQTSDSVTLAELACKGAMHFTPEGAFLRFVPKFAPIGQRF